MKQLIALLLVSLLVMGCVQQGQTATATPTTNASPTPAGTLKAVNTTAEEQDLQDSQQELDELANLTGDLEGVDFNVSDEELAALNE